MTEEAIIDFGVKARLFRTALAIDLQELALLSGLRVSEIIAIEQGTFPLTRPVVSALVQAWIDAPSMLFRATTKGSLSADPGMTAGEFFEAAPPEVQEATLAILREVGKAGVRRRANNPRN